MRGTFQELAGYIKRTGGADVEHTGGTYLGHIAGVYRDLKAWGCPEEVCRAGMFHSVYGTEIFQKFALPLSRRAEVRELIGERAERLAYLNSALEYESFDRAVARGTPPYVFRDRFSGEMIEVSPEDFDDLCRIHLCDRLEQAPRSRDWDFRPQVFRNLAARLGGVARECYESVYALAPEQSAQNSRAGSQ